MTPEQRALIERARRISVELLCEAETGDGTASALAHGRAKNVSALAAELKRAAEENVRLANALADAEQALRAEKSGSAVLSEAQEKTGEILGWRLGETTAEAATRMKADLKVAHAAYDLAMFDVSALRDRLAWFTTQSPGDTKR